MAVKSIEEFLEVKHDTDGMVDPDSNKHFSYFSEKLKYEIWLNLKERSISISADFNMPFGYSSLVEVSAKFDQIKIETEDEFYGDQKILVCRKNYEDYPNFKTLMIMRWPNGELSIWPNSIEFTECKD